LSEARIEVEVNGESRRVAEGLSLAGLLQELGVDRRTVVVELNRGIVRRDDLDDVRVGKGDRIEIVRFVGGG
jgi:thiamine biosynthesis protein ThiS